MRQEHQHYDAIEQHFRKSITQGLDFLFDTKMFEEELLRLVDTYDVPYELLQSFIRNLHIIHVKRTAPKVKDSLSSLLQQYSQGNAIKDIAKKVNYPPYLFARYIVEAVAVSTGGNKKKALAKAMRNPEQFLGNLDAISEDFRCTEPSTVFRTTTRLAQEVREAINADPMYGPVHDRDRHVVGIEYEVVLEFKLHAMGE